MLKPSRLALIVLLTACAAGQALADADTNWRLRVKREGSGWTVSFNGPQEYGSSAHRLKGSGIWVEKARSVGPFTKLRLDGPFDVIVTQAAVDGLKVAADDNVEPLIESRLDGDTLVLRLQPGAGFSTRHTPQVRIDAKSLQALAVSGSGDVSIERFKGDALALSVSGSGDLRVGMIEVRELTASLSGSGDVQMAGRADTQSWVLRGSGDVSVSSLSGQAVKVQIDGSGDMDLGVSETLDVSLRGSGDLRYAGRPQLRQSVSGSGELSHR